MADDDDRIRGPVMLCATSVMKPGPTRIGRVTKSITLPRTVALTSLFAGAVGVLVALAVVLPFFRSLQSLLVAAVLGGSAGIFVTTYSPLKGESMFKWLGLVALSTRRSHKIFGQPARLYVGVCPAPSEARGRIRIVPGAAPVAPGSVDERGCLLPDAAHTNAGILKRLGSRDLVRFDTSDIPDDIPVVRSSGFVFHRAVPAAHAPDTWTAQPAVTQPAPQQGPTATEPVNVTGPSSGLPAVHLSGGPRPFIRGGQPRPTPPHP